MPRVACVLTNGFEEIEFAGTFAILGRGGVTIDVAGLNSETLKGRYGLTISNLKSFEEIKPEDYDMLFIAGGAQYVELEKSEKFLNLIKSFHEKGKFISAICAGPTILGHLGLLKDKQYTCFNSMDEDFGGTFIDHYAVRDGMIITGKSAAATINFAFLVLETLTNKEHAEKVKNSIYYYNV